MHRVMTLALLLVACGNQDSADQRAVRRLCGLPDDAAVVSWDGFPSRSGFGQREGLEVAGTFRPSAGWRAEAAGYRLTPWPEARAAAESAFRLGAVFDGARAIRCETAGDDVLRAARTRPCDAVPRPLDLIACAELSTGEVRAVVRSAY
ncbi:MAG: hypothetical protein ACK53A_05550 [Gemmatimonadota bacterium]